MECPAAVCCCCCGVSKLRMLRTQLLMHCLTHEMSMLSNNCRHDVYLLLRALRARGKEGRVPTRCPKEHAALFVYPDKSQGYVRC
jgi:hypothetical protein